MVAVDEAERLIQENRFVPSTKIVELGASPGYTLAGPVYADRDLPPYHRVAMDGIAIFLDKGAVAESYPVEHVHAAGDPPYTLRSRLACVEVMTGSVLPEGTNTVIPYEDLKIENNVAYVLATPRQDQHVHARGADTVKGRLLLAPGTVIGAKEIAVLAAVGCARIPVFSIPTVAIVSTGNELTEVAAQPGPHQIRMSNNHALAAALAELKIESALYYLRDEAHAVQQTLSGILERHAIVILSGGVSKGKFDLIPDALARSGVKKVFHQIRQKPGKPFWFGRSAHNTVFALPGNPVSTFLCFHRYIRPWLQRSLAQPIKKETAQLAAAVTFALPVTYFLQVRLASEHPTTTATPVPGGGSGDFVNLLHADGFLELPSGQSTFEAGETFPLIRFS